MGHLIHRALIVDDEPTIREATSRAMSALSFCCETACDGVQALARYRQNPHDLVVSDLRMPKCHGHKLILELLREDEPPKIVVLTGLANHRIAQDLVSRGVEEIVHKPIDFHLFANKMKLLLDLDGGAVSVGSGKLIRATDHRHPLVVRIEADLEFFSMCIPEALSNLFFASEDLLKDPPQNMVQFLEHLSQQRAIECERRKMPRILLFSTAVAIPVSKDFAPLGAPCSVTFSDLSGAGACLLHKRPFDSDYVALSWQSLVTPKKRLQAVLKIDRCSPLGPFYEVAGPFVMHD